MDDDEKQQVLYHGTTLDVAQTILAQRSFECRPTYFAINRNLAVLFANRSSAKRSHAVAPAIVRVSMYASDFQQLRRGGRAQFRGFDEGDRPELRGQTQIILDSEGIRLLNRDMFADEMTIEPANGA